MSKMKGASLEKTVRDPKVEEYELEDDMRTLDRAHKILSDKERVKQVHKLAGRKHKAVSAMVEPHVKEAKKPKSIADLRKLANEPQDDE